MAHETATDREQGSAPLPAQIPQTHHEKTNSNPDRAIGGGGSNPGAGDPSGDGSDLDGVPAEPGETDEPAAVKPELPAENAHRKTVGKPPVGKPVGKSKISQQKQQLSRTEWFRYELDFRPLKSGFNVLIRKRLRWSDSRYSKMLVKRFCPQLTQKLVDQIGVGKFSKETVSALQNGGIQDGFIKELQARIGKGNGRRRTDLSEYERSLLARIESGIGASNRSEADPAGSGGEHVGISGPSILPTTPNGDFTEMPLVH